MITNYELSSEENAIKTYISEHYNKDTEVGKQLLKRQKEYLKIVERNRCLYEQNILAYNDLIDSVAQLVKKIGIYQNSISYIQVISKLINEGFLSDNCQFAFKEHNLRNIFGFLGMDVINGEGCSRNISALVTDILNKMRVYNENLPCLINNLSLYESLDIPANYFLNLINYDGRLYIYDAFKQRLYAFSSFLTLSLYQDNDSNIKNIFYKPDSDFIYNGKSFSEIKENINIFYDDSRLLHLGSDALYAITSETNHRYANNQERIYNFVKESQSYIRKIVIK